MALGAVGQGGGQGGAGSRFGWGTVLTLLQTVTLVTIGALWISGNQTTQGNANIVGNLQVGGAAHVAGTVTLPGPVHLGNTFHDGADTAQTFQPQAEPPGRAGMVTIWVDLAGKLQMKVGVTSNGNGGAVVATTSQDEKGSDFIGYLSGNTSKAGLVTTVLTKGGDTWSYSRSSTTVTLTTSTAHNMIVGQDALMAGWTDAVAALGDFTTQVYPVATVPTSTSFTFVYGSGNVGQANETDATSTVTPQGLGSGNVGIGRETLKTISSGSYSTAIGYGAGQNDTSGHNTWLGQSSGYQNTTGIYNAAVGEGSMGLQTFGDSSAAVGYRALRSSDGTNNVGIGALAGGTTLATGSYNILLGHGADTAAGNTSNVFVAGSSGSPINNVYFGKGMSHATPTSVTVNGTAGLGAGIAGADLVLAGGIAGDAATTGGSVVFKAAPAGAGQTLATVMTVAATTNISSLTVTANAWKPVLLANKTGGAAETQSGGVETVLNYDLPANTLTAAGDTVRVTLRWRDLNASNVAYVFSAGGATLLNWNMTGKGHEVSLIVQRVSSGLQTYSLQHVYGTNGASGTTEFGFGTSSVADDAVYNFTLTLDGDSADNNNWYFDGATVEVLR